MQPDKTALTVTQLNRQIRSWLESEIAEVTVIGELSNLSKPSSGHFYFSLKDSTAQIRCVFFRNYHSAQSVWENGQQVIAQGKLSLYEARGDYQLIVQTLSPAGLGQLYYQFEQLKQKLQALGLFDPARKKPMPFYPLTIGVITSPTGAALQDILTTLKRRFPLAAVKIYCSEVQGKEAAKHLINALLAANREALAEVLILARGGGSIEDLWAFNDEQLALAISQSEIPIVSGVGHETDFTIADFVADLRAATPTAAAEAITPHQNELFGFLEAINHRLHNAMHRYLQHQKLRLSHKLALCLSPKPTIAKHWQAIDLLDIQLNQCIRNSVYQKERSLQNLLTRLYTKNPSNWMAEIKSNLKILENSLIQTMRNKYQQLRQNFQTQLATLDAVSPLATLDRGYALATYKDKVLLDSQQIRAGEQFILRLAKGKLGCEVINVDSGNRESRANESLFESEVVD